MGTWGVAPWDNDEAADWFSQVFEGIDIDSKIEEALEYDYDNYDQVRAAAYLLHLTFAGNQKRSNVLHNGLLTL